MTTSSDDNKYISAWVGDGYDRVATIPAVEGRWSAVRVRFRPFGADEISIINAKQQLNFGSGYCTHYAEAMAGDNPKILDWDLKHKNAKGELVKVPVNPESVRKLAFGFYCSLRELVEGDHPEWEEGESQGAEGDTKN